MAKGQKRSGREPKKPKKAKLATAPAPSQGLAALRAPKPTPGKPADK